MFNGKKAIKRLKRQLINLDKDKARITGRYEEEKILLEGRYGEDVKAKEEQIVQKNSTLDNIIELTEELQSVKKFFENFLTKISDIESNDI